MRIFFSTSTDGGATWDTPRKLNDQSSKNDQFFPRLALDEASGDLMLVYYDTVADTGRLKTDVWMQSSTDGGVRRGSDAQKVTTQQTDEATANKDNGNQYGDYIGLTGYAGQFFACWTDRRGGTFEEIWGRAAPARGAQGRVRDRPRPHREGRGRRSPHAAGRRRLRHGVPDRVDGFTARELGVTGAGSTGLGPPVTLSPAPGMTATCTSVDSTDPPSRPTCCSGSASATTSASGQATTRSPTSPAIRDRHSQRGFHGMPQPAR